ncbi:exonuclease SbcCD subunit D [Mobilitalea sibirica]|uniref:Exonuclease SbcCD subunit D n=1 Tax=Mobilitalea sibirica TaxID=1462919 RepID=A0A8J7KXR2_9FIRM|nr:exonuclease SbcCD subunit D [Mobilitalea sibirica]MBH1942117.1 exonuclease SbcCD subunit D [Mobilitalea sibirica]
MKFIHIADVHLGATPDSDMPWGADREKELWDSLYNVIELCNQNKVDLLLIAGDLFHKQPRLRDLKEVNYLFSKIETAEVVLMAGNHDYIGPRSYYPGFLWDARVHMFIKEEIDVIELPKLNTEIYGLSYHNRDITEPLYDSLKVGKQDKVQILLAHGGDEKNIPMNRKKLSVSGFDYIALGHIHKPEIVGEKMAYAGSLEPLDKNETGERGYILGEITLDPIKKTMIRFIPGSLRQYKRLDLMIDKNTTNGSLVDKTKLLIQKQGSQHIYQFTIRGFREEDIHFDKQALLSLGNVLEVTDETVPDYDFDQLYQENEDNMIGLFIRRIRENVEQDEVAKKALYYGLEALLNARE